MLNSKEPITLDNACYENWSVQILCTGTADPAHRRLCVVGCSLGGDWYRPPAYFTDTMVLLVLRPKKGTTHYSIVDIPYKQGDRHTWCARWNRKVVELYTSVVKNMFALGVSSQSPVFLGVSAGILSTMVLLTSLIHERVSMTTPLAVFIAGAWHPEAHPRFRNAVLSLGPKARPRVFVVNHKKDSLCAWREQECFWHQLERQYADLVLAVLEYHGSAAPALFALNCHDLGGRIVASTKFWNWLSGEDVSPTELYNLATVACDWNATTRVPPFPGYAHSLGLRLLCKLWRQMRIPNLDNLHWAEELLDMMRQSYAGNCPNMLRAECLSEWPPCLYSSKLGEYYQDQFCDSFANSLREGKLQSDIDGTPVSLQLLHQTDDMNLVNVTFWVHDGWLRPCWIQIKDDTSVEDVPHETIIFTPPCIIVFRFTRGSHIMGFYQSHDKPKPGKRRADGTKKYHSQYMKSVVIACPTGLAQDLANCFTEVLTCHKIEVVRLTSLMGIGSLGPMIFPPEEDADRRRFRAWIAEKDASTQIPAEYQFDASKFHAVLPAACESLPPGIEQNLGQLIPLVQENLMSAMIGPPGTGKTTNIAGLLRLLLEHHRSASSAKPLRILLCAPTNHAVQELEDMVSKLTPKYEFAFIRLCSARKMEGNVKGTSFSAGRRKGFDSSDVDRPAEHVKVSLLKEVLQNSQAKVTIILSTVGVLQKSPSVVYDPLKVIHKYFNWIVVDEAGQTVDTDAYVLHSLLSTYGRYVLVGDAKQLSCFSTLRLPRRSAMHAALRWNSKMCLTVSFRLMGTLGHFFCQTIYEAEGMQLHNKGNCRSLIFVEISSAREQSRDDEPRSSNIAAELESNIAKNLLSLKTSDELHYITFYKAQKNYSKMR